MRSGRLTVRIPPSLHRDLSEAAKREGVSLNRFASAALARAVGRSDVEGSKPSASTRRETSFAEQWRNLAR